MKRILIISNHHAYTYNFRKEIIEELIKNDYEVYLTLPYGEMVDDLIALGCHYIESELSRHGTNVLEDFKLLLRYRSIMKEVRPDIVLTFTIKPNIYGGLACRSLNIPQIANITGLGTAVENPGLMQKITVQLYKHAFKNVHTVFFQNEENMQFFVDRKIALGKHKLLPGSGVNTERFSLLEYPSDEVIRFVFISRIMKEKGIDYYLEAAKYIKAKYPNTEFHICGFSEEDYEDTLKEYEEKGIINYHGMVRDIRTILKDMHCTIHPTYYPEGMSNVLLESAASGRPVIATNRSGCREIIDDNVNGYLVEPKNERDLISAITKFLKLDYKSKKLMGLKGREKVTSDFDRKIVVNSYMEVID